MSNQQQKGGPGWGTIIGVGAGLGLAAAAAYALMNDTETPLASFSRRCNKCSEVINDDSEEIKLLCNHVYHKNCLLEAYQLHKAMNWSNHPFECPSCHFRIPPSVITKLTDQRALPGSSSFSVSTEQCKFCDKSIGDDDIIRLLCSHSFHKSCIMAYVVLQSVKNVFTGGGISCPVSYCNKKIPENTIDSLMR